ncbi:MAG TPA: Flp pilus assembly protein CpaB [Clostridia bacterium]|nr:Flp pilus assembly protein CpaB [Clostridia bacterium]
MDSRRIGLALLLAVVVAAGSTYFFYSRLRAERSQNKVTQIVAAAKALPAGSPIGADGVVMVNWPADMKLEGSFAKPDEVIGRSLIYPVNANQPLLLRDLALPGSGIGLTVKIPEGMRALSLRSNEILGVAGFLYPGSHVDVLVTYRPDGSNTPVTSTVLQNVEVLTAGQRIEPDPQGKPETVNVVTLLVKPNDGEKLVLASTQGSVQFVLRNGADQVNVETSTVGIDDLTAGFKKPATAAPKKLVKAAVVKPPKFYEVETIVNGKRTVDKFEN